MFLPWSVLSLRRLARFANPVFERTVASRISALRQERVRQRRRLRLEVLEDRTVLSTWVPKGPAPILNGAPGGDPASGRIAALAADPTDVNTIYIAAAGGGVWKTTNGGTNWTPLTDSQDTLFMGAIALAPSDPNSIYAGTGEATNSGLSFYGRGVLKSTDGGASWTLLGNAQFNRRTIAQIVVHPSDPNTVYVAVAFGVNGLSGNTGIWKSTNGGSTWTNTTTSISTTEDYSDLAMDPADPQTLFAAVGTEAGSAANSVYKTSDGGTTWAIAGNIPKGTANGNTKVALAPTDHLVLYASIANPSSGALFKMMKSVDGGTTWMQLTSTPNYMGNQGWYDSSLAVDPASADVVYAGGAAGLNSIIRTLNGGATWSDISLGANGHGPHVDHHGIGFDAAGRLLDGDDGGIWRLNNQNPVQWADLNGNLQITQFIGIGLHPTNANIAYGGSQDNGTEKFTGTLSWQEVAFGDGGFVRVDQSNPNTVYHEFNYISVQRSDNGGMSWVTKRTGIGNDPANFYVPYVMDPSNSSRLLLGTNRVYETTNRADNWTAISTPDHNGWVGSSVIDSLGVAPGDVNTVYAAAASRLFVTTDHGASWNQRNIAGASHIQDIKVDPADSQTAYAVKDRFGGGHVFRTTNGGLNWVDISGNLPDLPTYSIVLRAGALFAGTDDGVYSSTDAGVTWSRLGDGLPHAQVRELVLNSTLGILAAGTHGRGLWELNVGATHFSVVPSITTVTAGTPFSITVTALDDQNNAVPDYVGTVHFTNIDGATLPGDYTFTGADLGTHTFDGVVLRKAGSQTVTVTDTVTSITGNTTIAVTPAAASHFTLSAPAGSTAGTAFDITVTALDPFENVDVNYVGTAHFTTTDPGPGFILPADTTFTGTDAGQHTFANGVTLVTAGPQTITVMDTGSGFSGSATVTVTAAAPDHLIVTGPASVTSGMAFDVTVTVQDAFSNIVAAYLGTVHFMTSDNDPGVVVPDDYTFTDGDGGTHTFTNGVTLITVGDQTITVYDPAAAISGSATVTVVSPGPPPGGGGGGNGPNGGLFPTPIGVLFPLTAAPLASANLAPANRIPALRSPDLDAGSVNWLFAATNLGRRTPLFSRAAQDVPAEALEGQWILGRDGILADWTVYPLPRRK